MDLAKFKILERLGKGAFGSVWKAVYRRTGKIYALKSILMKRAPENISSAAELALGVEHPNLLRVYDYFYQNLIPNDGFQAKNHIIFIMEYIPGIDLYTKIRRGDPIDLELYVPQILDAAEYLHDIGMIHRDLKPENMLIMTDNRLKVIDYDFLTDDPEGKLGTPFYAAPEIYLKRRYDHKVDLWSLGITIWTAITQIEPFDAQSRKSLAEKVVDEEPDWDKVKDHRYYSILKGLLEKNPDNRMDIDEVRCILEENRLKKKSNST